MIFLVLFLYITAVALALKDLKISKITPSRVYSIAVILLAPPTYLLDVHQGYYQGELFTVPALTTHLLTGVGLYGSVILIRYTFPRISRNTPRVRSKTISITRISTYTLPVIFVIILAWVISPPRLLMLKSLYTGISQGDSALLNEYRRYVFSSGFFNQKVFTWTRFSIAPLLILITLDFFKYKQLGWKIISSIICLVLYLFMSASAHKSTWFIGVIYISFFWMMHSKNKIIRSELRIVHSALFVIIGFMGIISLLTISYYFQYRANENLTSSDFLIGALRRVGNAVTEGFGFFSKIYPGERPFQGADVVLPSFLRDAANPEQEVALDFGLNTTIQPGVLGRLYSGLGLFSIPFYYVYVFAMCRICDAFVNSLVRADFKIIFTTILCVNITWILQMPLYPSISSSGILLTLMAGVVIKFLGLDELKPNLTRKRKV